MTDNVFIGELTDDELAEALKEYGFDPGPIVATTRSVYERKLERLMTASEDANDQGNNSNEEESGDTRHKDVSHVMESFPKDISVDAGFHMRHSFETKRYVRKRDVPSHAESAKNYKDESKSVIKQENKKTSWLSIWVQLIILLVMAALVYLVIMNMEQIQESRIPRLSDADVV